MFTTPSAGTYELNLDEGETLTGRNFGNFELGVLSGVKFNDLNADGERDADEPGLAGWTVFVDADRDGVLDDGELSDVTDSEGAYRIEGIGPGLIQVGEILQDGWTRTTLAAPLVVTSGFESEVNIGNTELVSISGVKFNDLDGDGERDAGEAGIEGWTIFLDHDADGELDPGEEFTLTDASGGYRFDALLPGAYTVAEVQVEGWVQTSPETLLPADIDVSTTASAIAMESAGCSCGSSWTNSTSVALVDYGAEAIASALDLTGVTAALSDPQFAGIDGTGVTTVVIDTGIDIDHPYFGPDNDGDGIADRILFQYDFADDDTDASDVNGHGSHIASLIGSQDDTYGGVASGTDLIVLKVFEDNGHGQFSYLEEALQWVVNNREAFNVGVVNLSLGDGGNWDSDFSRYGVGDEFAALATTETIVVAAAGNNYYQYGSMGLAYPASDPAVLSVGSVWADDFGGPWKVSTGAIDYVTGADHISAFSQRDDQLLDVFAPGARFNGANESGGIETMQGTSQASAFVSGIAALSQQIAMQELGRGLSTGEFGWLIEQTSDWIVDGDDEVDNVPNTGAAYQRINFEALSAEILSLGEPADGDGTSGTVQGEGPLQQAATGVYTLDLAAGENATGMDFGNFELIDVSGTVFNDLNIDANRDTGEAGLEGWTVFLDADLDGQLDADEESVTTDANGAFGFADLGPGTYRVAVDTPAGWALSTDAFFDVFATSGSDADGLFGANRTPVASDDLGSTLEDTVLNGDVAGNDTDPDGPEYIATVIDGPAHGELTLNSNGTFVYTPNADYHGDDSFTYRVGDGLSQSNLATVELTITSVNDAPEVGSDAYSLDRNQTLAVPVPGVLGNDDDVDGDTLSAQLISGPSHGTLELNTDGSFSYTPNFDYVGSDSFVYAADDGATQTQQTVNLSVGFFNTTPEADDDAYEVDEDAVLNVVASGVLGNDDDADGDDLTATLVSGPSHGSLTLNADGSFGYAPDTDYHGEDSFTYVANDSSADSNVATVSITVNPVNDAPVADNDAYDVDEDAVLNVAASGVLGNDDDVDGDDLTAALVSGPSHGSLILNADGSFSYTPEADYHGEDSFTYVANDGSEDSNVATVSITVNPVNDAPAADDDAYEVDEDAVLDVAASGVLGNDDDADGDDLTARLVSGPSHGTLELNTDGSFGYTPEADYHGSDSFTYVANDGSTDSNVATVTITVNPVAVPFQVSTFMQTDSGFHLGFSEAFDPNRLNLFNAADDPRGEPDLVLMRDGEYYPMRGSLVIDSDLMGATFLQTNGVLETGDYTLTLASRADGWVAAADGSLLDGDGDGNPGGDYVHAFSVASFDGAVLSIGELMAGPGQAFDVAADPVAGIPVTLTNAAGLSSASFDLAYDPELVDLTDLVFGTGFTDAGSSIDSDNGILHIVANASGIGAGDVEVVRLVGSVSDDAAYRGKQLLDLHNVALDDGGRDVRVDDGLHVAAFVADTDGSAGYLAIDQARLMRVVRLQDSGFSMYPLVDPTVVADVNDNQALTLADVGLLARELRYLSNPVAYGALNRPEIPDVTVTPVRFAGADPLVNIPEGIEAAPGEVITVPVMLSEIEEGLDSVPLESSLLEVRWNPDELRLLNVARGDLTEDFELFNVTSGEASLRIDMGSYTIKDVVRGSLAELRLRVLASEGEVAIDLAHAELNGTRLTLNSVPVEGADPTDGSVTVVPGEPALPIDTAVGVGQMEAALATKRTNEGRSTSVGIAKPSPVVDFGSSFRGFEVQREGSSRTAGEWLGDWVSQGGNGRSDQVEALRITPKVSPELTSKLTLNLHGEL